MRGLLVTALVIVIGMPALAAQALLTVSVRVVRSCPVDVQGSTTEVVVQCNGNAAPRAQITESTDALPSPATAPAPQTSDDSFDSAPFVENAGEAGSESSTPTQEPKARFRVLTINY